MAMYEGTDIPIVEAWKLQMLEWEYLDTNGAFIANEMENDCGGWFLHVTRPRGVITK